MAQMRATAPSTYHSLLPSGTPPLLPIPLPALSTSRRADISEADTPPQKRLLLTTPGPGCEVGESSAVADAYRERMKTALEMANKRDSNQDNQETYGDPQALARLKPHCRALRHEFTVLETEVHRHEWQRQAADDLAVQHIMQNAPIETTRSTPVTPTPNATTTTIVTEAQLQALIDQGGAAAMAEAEASMVRNGYNNNAAHAMPWATLKKMMTDKYCPRGEIKKIETEMKFRRDRQELKLISVACRYDTRSVSIKAENDASRLSSLQTELMKRVSTIAERQAENKRKFENTSRNNQNKQQQQNKRQNTGQAYTAGNSDRKSYARPKPLCSKCNYNREGPCPPRCNNYKKVGHLAKDYRSRPANANNNNHNNNNNNQKGNAGNDKAPVKVYVVGNAGANPDNVVAAPKLTSQHLP
ncbi:hypothetical protein Tco_1491446 [Tanacetum coccineum]